MHVLYYARNTSIRNIFYEEAELVLMRSLSIYKERLGEKR